jgi:predicted MFS family arabinose efflux permease
MPVIAKTIFHVQAQELGYMYAATGLGSLLATLLVGAYSKKIRPVTFVIVGNVIFSVSLMLFSQTDSVYMALPLLFFIGMGLLAQAATMNTLIQTVVKNEFRGRVMSLYILMFLGFAPFGNFEIGFLSEKIGIPYTLMINAAIVLIFGLIVYGYSNKIRTRYQEYKAAH